MNTVSLFLIYEKHCSLCIMNTLRKNNLQSMTKPIKQYPWLTTSSIITLFFFVESQISNIIYS